MEMIYRSSRGPTADGDIGVCVSAPGCAVAPVPTWTLQWRMLMNGTSTASPSACGGIALLISAMKAEGIPVSLYSVRKALENTSNPIGDSLEDKLSTGQGLMQVDKFDIFAINGIYVIFVININQILDDRCYGYTQQSQNIPNPFSRGIYLREANACQQPTEWMVQVDPKFHENANKLEELAVFEECFELHSLDKTVVKAPEYLLLTHNGCTFKLGPIRPIDAKISALSSDRDKLPSGKQILALTLTYKIKLEDGAEIKPQIPFLNDRLYDSKFESQFYIISDSNKQVYSSGDVYPNSTKLPKGEYNLQLYLRHDNLQILEKMKQLVLFIERNLEEKVLCFFSQPEGLLMGNGSFKSSSLVPGIKEGFCVGPPPKDKLPKVYCSNSLPNLLGISIGLLVKCNNICNIRTLYKDLFWWGSISYGKLSFAGQGDHKNPEKHPVSYRVSYIIPPNKIDEDKGKNSSLSSKKTVSERLEQESEYPNPLLAKILEGLVSRSYMNDKFHHHEEVIDAANEVIDSIDRQDLAKFFALKNDPEDEEEEKIKKKMESIRDQLAEALYQKGLAQTEIESLKY
ncbi:Tripeptidyl-peptidase 2, partial [Mucuna pruriens]